MKKRRGDQVAWYMKKCCLCVKYVCRSIKIRSNIEIKIGAQCQKRHAPRVYFTGIFYLFEDVLDSVVGHHLLLECVSTGLG